MKKGILIFILAVSGSVFGKENVNNVKIVSSSNVVTSNFSTTSSNFEKDRKDIMDLYEKFLKNENNKEELAKITTKDFSKLNTYEVSQKGKKVAIIGLGTFYQLGEKVAKLYQEKTGTQATVINPMYITGVDEKLLEELKKDHSVVLTLEDGILDGGFGEKIARFYGNSDMKVLNYGLKKEFLDRYDIGKLLRENRLKADLIVEDLLKF